MTGKCFATNEASLRSNLVTKVFL